MLDEDPQALIPISRIKARIGSYGASISSNRITRAMGKLGYRPLRERDESGNGRVVLMAYVFINTPKKRKPRVAKEQATNDSNS